jgi:hypothetical protein
MALGQSSGSTRPGSDESAELLVLLQSSVFRHTLLEAKDLPDIGVLPKQGNIIVRQEIGRQKLEVDPRSLPKVRGVSFVLMPKDQIQDRANREHDTFTYVVLSSLDIDGPTAKVAVGTDMAIPENSGIGKLCCCIGTAEFKLIRQAWVFIKWTGIICS